MCGVKRRAGDADLMELKLADGQSDVGRRGCGGGGGGGVGNPRSACILLNHCTA